MKYACVFPGQGAQSVGMGQADFEQDSEFKEVYDLTDKIFAEVNQESNRITQLSFSGPEETLIQTLYTQPAILALSIALAKKFKTLITSGKLPKPDYVAGHSLGEFSALYMADVLDLESCIRLVVKRAKLMQAAPAGAMTAVLGMPAQELEIICSGIDSASIANYNSPDQIVLTGSKQAMEEAAKQIQAKAEELSAKAKVIPLKVGGAFHSPLMQEAATKFAEEIDDCDFNNASFPVIQNVTARPELRSEDIINNLKKQMTSPVYWTQTVALLLAEDRCLQAIYEIGPGKVLAGLVKKQNRRFPVTNITDLESLKQFNAATV